MTAGGCLWAEIGDVGREQKQRYGGKGTPAIFEGWRRLALMSSEQDYVLAASISRGPLRSKIWSRQNPSPLIGRVSVSTMPSHPPDEDILMPLPRDLASQPDPMAGAQASGTREERGINGRTTVALEHVQTPAHAARSRTPSSEEP
jgi:hypothetical protein